MRNRLVTHYVISYLYTMEFEFAKTFDEHREKHLAWWLSLTPAQRWKSNWEQVMFFAKVIDGYLTYETNNYILK